MGASRRSDGGWATANDWVNYRPLITSLYRDQNKTLAETKRIMEERHQFSATVRMYKARFQLWGIQKKIKAADAVEIARQQAARSKDGKTDSVVYIGGRKITPDRLRRYRYRASAQISERITREERQSASSFADAHSRSSHIVLRTPSPSPSPSPSPTPTPEDAPRLAPRLNDPADHSVPINCMLILRSYIAGSIDKGTWSTSTAAPVPNAFTWAHYLATSQALVAHNRTKEGFAVLNLCLDEYKSHVKNPDPFFWLATYKAALVLALKDDKLGNMFIDYASSLAREILPREHPFNHIWEQITTTGLNGIRQHAAALFESYLVSYIEMAGSLPTDEKSLIQMAFVFIQLQCSGMVSYRFTKQALGGMMKHLSGSVAGQFLLQEAKFRMACLYLEQDRLDEADFMTKEILEWIDFLPPSEGKEFNHLRCKCLWTLFEIESKKENIEEAAQIGQNLVDLCRAFYGPAHLQTIDAISALQKLHQNNNNTAGAKEAAKKAAKEFAICWAGFSDNARRKGGFPHNIEQPWLHRCIELEEDESRIEEVIGLLERCSWMGTP